MGLSHQGQHCWHFLWVMEVLHHIIDGIHHSAGMVSKLATSLHLLWILHVLELAEVLFGWWEVDEEPKEANTFQITLKITLFRYVSSATLLSRLSQTPRLFI